MKKVSYSIGLAILLIANALVYADKIPSDFILVTPAALIIFAILGVIPFLKDTKAFYTPLLYISYFVGALLLGGLYTCTTYDCELASILLLIPIFFMPIVAAKILLIRHKFQEEYNLHPKQLITTIILSAITTPIVKSIVFSQSYFSHKAWIIFSTTTLLSIAVSKLVFKEKKYYNYYRIAMWTAAITACTLILIAR